MEMFPVKTLALASAILLSACGSSHDRQMANAGATDANAGPMTHCEGSEWTDNSSIAVLPVPFVAFFVPHADINEVKEDTYTARCGDRARLRNEKVEVSKVACIPAGLTRIITLGVWQWCPAHVNWEADVR